MRIKITDCSECKAFDENNNYCSYNFGDFEFCKYNIYYDSDGKFYIYESKITNPEDLSFDYNK